MPQQLIQFKCRNSLVPSHIRLAEAPGNVELPIELTGVSKDSVVNVSQIFTVNKTF